MAEVNVFESREGFLSFLDKEGIKTGVWFQELSHEVKFGKQPLEFDSLAVESIDPHAVVFVLNHTEALQALLKHKDEYKDRVIATIMDPIFDKDGPNVFGGEWFNDKFYIKAYAFRTLIETDAVFIVRKSD